MKILTKIIINNYKLFYNIRFFGKASYKRFARNAFCIWAKSKGYSQGVFWISIACVFSSLNDVLTKCIGSRLSGSEITFFRFLFSTIVLLPFGIKLGRNFLQTHHIGIHFIRSFLLMLAMSLWSYSLSSLPITLITTIGFTTPLFVLPLARVFLRERVCWRRWLTTFLGFIGILLSIQPIENTINPMLLLLIASTLIFASLDVINKRLLIKNESLFSMLFYSGLGAVILGFLPAVLTWETPTLYELSCLLILGVSGSFVLYSLLKAFSATEVSSLQSFRYLEFLLSVFLGVIFFKELPNINI